LTPAPRLAYRAGVHARADDALDDDLARTLTDAIAAGTCSAAAAACGDGVRARAWYAGTTRAWPSDGTRIDAATPFDVASLTKPMATALVAMRLLSAGAVALDARAARWLPAVPAGITLAHLLGHASGLPCHRPFFERIWRGDLGGAADPRAALVAMAATAAPERAPGAAAVYSDLGYVVLGALLERIADAPLEELTAAAHRELGLAAARFVDLRPGHRAPLAAPPVATERDDRRGLVAGEVHDENCHAAGGVAGHAGLFAPLPDVARFAELMAAAPRVGAPGLRAAVVAGCFTTAAAPMTSWRLGWDTPSSVPGVSHAGDAWPRAAAVGHLGFTGTSIWLDWASGRWLVLLTNRVHPDRARPAAAAIKPLRRAVGDQAWALLTRGL
jgi:CubicO group peptidase (beta-lactamase class C family)